MVSAGRRGLSSVQTRWFAMCVEFWNAILRGGKCVFGSTARLKDYEVRNTPECSPIRWLRVADVHRLCVRERLKPPSSFRNLHYVQLSSQRERSGEEIAEELYLTAFVANFPQFQLFMFAFIPDMDILCLGAPAFLPGAAGLYNRLAGLFFPLFDAERKKKRRQFFFQKMCPSLTRLPEATVKLSHFLKLHFHKSNDLHSEITSITVASRC